jgi:hypothetical protein
MSNTNHGTQAIAVSYFMNALSGTQNKTTHQIVSRGIYNGGYLTRESDSEVTLSPFTVSIGDSLYQISVTSSANATLNSGTLDGGTISASTPYLVMRWSYAAVINNYVGIYAVANLAAVLANDIVIGKCVFGGTTLSPIFDYTDRTNPLVAYKLLKVEALETPSMTVRIKGGMVQTGSSYANVKDQLISFTAPASPNSRIDLVCIDSAGAVIIVPGTPAPSPTAPSYAGKLVVAEITIANGTTTITNSLIKDVRSFLSSNVVPDDTTLQLNTTSGKMEIKDPFYGIKYDSNWFACATGQMYTKTHGLGSYLISTTILFAPDSAGSPDLTKITKVNLFELEDFHKYDIGALIQNITTTQLVVVTGNTGVAARYATVPHFTTYANGWYRILAVKIA